MKLSSLSVKRRPVKKGGLRTLFANVPRKKVRAATSAAPLPEVEGDVPNLGIARALVVILIIHVVAIAGIFAHSRWFEGPEQKAAIAAKQEQIVPVRPLPDAQATLPQLEQGDEAYPTKAGDTYRSIALEKGVTEEELRQANGNMELRAGRILRIPPRTIVAVEPEEFTRLRGDTPAEIEVPVDEIRSARMVETEAASTPVLARPNVRPAEAPPVAIPVREESTPAASRKYTVKAGDTFWRIAQSHETTAAAIMKANRISDPRKLKVGMEIVIP